MKLIQRATVTWPTTPDGNTHLGSSVDNPHRGCIVKMAGSRCTVSVPPAQRGGPFERVETLTGASMVANEAAKRYEITGQSEHLLNMGMVGPDATVTIIVEGGACETC